MASGEGPWRAPDPKPRPPRRGGLVLVLAASLVALLAALAHAFPESLQTGDGWTSLGYGLGLIVLVSAALGRLRRETIGAHLKNVAIWAALVAVLALGYAYREEIAGVPRHLAIAFSAADPVVTAEHELVVPQDETGAYEVVGQVNGQRVMFVLDTGASDTVLSPSDARRLGVDVGALDYRYPVETANGAGHAAPFTADRVEIGPIELREFPMSVNQAAMSRSLLGLSFLRRLEAFEVRDRKLILRWRDPQG